MVMKRPTHSLTAYNFLFKYTRSKLLHSTAITDNDAVVAFPSLQKFFDTLNLPREDRTDKTSEDGNATTASLSVVEVEWRSLDLVYLNKKLYAVSE